MPTYDYECSGCGHTFEILQSMSENPLRKCPHCGKLKLARLIGSGAGIIFKGSGFYETDYKKKSQPKEPSRSESKSDKASPSTKGSKNVQKGCGSGCACHS